MGKTRLLTTLGQALDVSFGRVQFTPDLMPADILGTKVLHENRFEFHEGPIFATWCWPTRSIVPPRRRNRRCSRPCRRGASPSVARHTSSPSPSWSWRREPDRDGGHLPPPRGPARPFLFKILVPFPGTGDMVEILRRTTTAHDATAHAAADGPTLLEMGKWYASCPPHLTCSSSPPRSWRPPIRGGELAPERVRRYVRHGASRAAQALVLGGKARPDRRPAKSRRRRRGGIGTSGAAPPPGPRLRGGGGWGHPRRPHRRRCRRPPPPARSHVRKVVQVLLEPALGAARRPWCPGVGSGVCGRVATPRFASARASISPTTGVHAGRRLPPHRPPALGSPRGDIGAPLPSGGGAHATARHRRLGIDGLRGEARDRPPSGGNGRLSGSCRRRQGATDLSWRSRFVPVGDRSARPPPLVVATDRAVAGADRAGSCRSRRSRHPLGQPRRAPWQCSSPICSTLGGSRRSTSSAPRWRSGAPGARRGRARQLVGDLDLIDGETGVRLPFSASVEALDGYQHRLEEFLAAVAGRSVAPGWTTWWSGGSGRRGSGAATAGRGGGSAVRFLVPAALGVAALAVPLVALYMLRSRRQRTPVSSVYLWDRTRCRRRFRQRLLAHAFCWPSLPSWRSSPCCWRVPSSSRRPCSDRTPSS